MRFGVCGDMGVAAIAAGVSYDYAEWNVAGLLAPREPEDVFRTSLEAIRAAELPYPVANGFVPGDLKITGPAVDLTSTSISLAMIRARVVLPRPGGPHNSMWSSGSWRCLAA